MCFGMKKVVNWEPRWNRTRTPVHLPTVDTQMSRIQVIIRESWHPETHN
jgi:hypothetical protein